MELVVDYKQGFFHKPTCRLVKPAMVLNQSEHDFRKVFPNKMEDLVKKNFVPCSECIEG